MLYVVYGLYYGLAYGTAKAMVADLVPEVARHGLWHLQRRAGHAGFAGLADRRPALAGSRRWPGFGPSAPFLFGGVMALMAALLMALWKPGQVTL